MPDADRRTRLEQELRRLGRDLEAQLGEVDLAPMVVGRLGPVRQPSRGSAGGRRWRLAIALAAALGVAVTATVPAARAAFTRVFDLGAVSVRDEPPPVTATAAALRLGNPTTLAEAASRMPVVVPTLDGFGDPDEVWFNRVGGGQVSLVYGPGVEVLIQEFLGDGHEIIRKYLTTDARATRVSVNGERGVFVSGGQHAVFYVDESGHYVEESGRLAGNALIVERGPVTIRIEADLPRDDLVAIAESFSRARGATR